MQTKHEALQHGELGAPSHAAHRCGGARHTGSTLPKKSPEDRPGVSEGAAGPRTGRGSVQVTATADWRRALGDSGAAGAPPTARSLVLQEPRSTSKATLGDENQGHRYQKCKSQGKTGRLVTSCGSGPTAVMGSQL